MEQDLQEFRLVYIHGRANLKTLILYQNEGAVEKATKNENYYGSKVLYYGEDVPEELRVKQDIVDLNERRVIQEPKKEEKEEQ